MHHSHRRANCMAIPAPKSMLAGLLQALSGPEPLIILPHDNPDPDSLASAAALKYLAQELLEKDAVIAQGGIVGRAENRAMLTYLNIDLKPVRDLRLRPDSLVALVDTQPGRINNSLPREIIPAVVIDHHPAYADYGQVPFLDLRDEYGATSTILTEYVREARVELESKLATALFYGQFLYPYTNKRRLAKIENARVPRVYFRAFHEAIERAVIYNRVVVSILPQVQYPDMVAEVADFLLRLDEVEWACAIGGFGDNLHVSLRTTERDVSAGDVLQRVLGNESAGGHDMTAGGRVPLDSRGPDAAVQAAGAVRERLLALLDAATAPPHALV